MRPQAPKCRRDYFGVDPVVLVEVLLFFFFAFLLALLVYLRSAAARWPRGRVSTADLNAQFRRCSLLAGCRAGASQARRRASASQWIRRITSPVSATCQRAFVPVRGGGPTCTVIELRRLRTANASSSASPAPT